VRYPPDAAHCAEELLSIVAYLAAPDGPLQAAPGVTVPLSPWHKPLLGKASERLEVIDAYMRARVSFLIGGRDRGYHTPEAELELAGATLDAGRTTAPVVDALLASRLPSQHEFDAMSAAVLRLHPALEAMHASEDPPRS
jgi:hypothetical protein